MAHEELKTQIDKVGSLFAEARKQEMHFILYDRKEVSFLEKGKCESLLQHKRAMQEAKQLIAQIKRSEKLTEKDEIYQEMEAVQAALESYQGIFSHLVNSYKIRGFKDHGLEGRMRAVIHKLQECESKEEQWYALMLRRHEKDFFIRQDPKYIKTLHKRAQEFTDFVEASDLPHMNPEYKEKTIASVKNYVRHFNKIAAIEKEIGLTKKEGIIGSLTIQAELTEPLLINVQKFIHEETRKLAGNSILIILVSGGLMLICGTGFSFLLSHKISRPIIHLSRIVEKAKVGDDTTIRTLRALRRNDELGMLVNSFEGLFQEINQKVQEISEKNEVLQKAAQKEKERTWFSTGLSIFENLMSGHANNISVLCDQFLLNLVKYTRSNQAVLFIKDQGNGGKPCMKLQSCYAFDKKRYITGSIEMGEGLAGAVWQEKEPFYMNDIPESYSKIRSGLGNAKPRSVFIVPAILENEAEAVIEIGAFQEYSEIEKELILEVSKSFAGAIARVQLQERSELLLKQANILTEGLKQNEEELKQQMEEMIASQEESAKNQQSLQVKVDTLQNNLKILGDYASFNFKGIFITDQEFNMVYHNNYWQEFFGRKEGLQEQKINKIFNVSEKEIEKVFKDQHQVLLQHLNQKVLVNEFDEKDRLSAIKIAEHLIEQKVFYSVMTN